MIADRPRLDCKMSEQLPRLASVLAGNQVCLLQHAESTQCDVLKIANGRGYQIKPGREIVLRGHERECSTATCFEWRSVKIDPEFVSLHATLRISVQKMRSSI